MSAEDPRAGSRTINRLSSATRTKNTGKSAGSPGRRGGRRRFRNSQWAVTAYGLESVGQHAGYDLSKRLLAEAHWDRPGFLFTPLHVCEKTWVDLDAFFQAFEHALVEHRLDVSPETLERTREAAYAAREESEAFSAAFSEWMTKEGRGQSFPGGGRIYPIGDLMAFGEIWDARKRTGRG